jgi:PadR family transcriptional regulator, regulatory protein PadR
MSTPAEPRPALPKNFLRPCVLLLLREQPAHGYELLERLQAFGFDRDDPGRLYRALRALEEERLVQSAWEPSQSGPARRIYEITRRGMEHLHDSVLAIRDGRSLVDVFVSRYAEFVALDREPRPSRSAR